MPSVISFLDNLLACNRVPLTNCHLIRLYCTYLKRNSWSNAVEQCNFRGDAIAKKSASFTKTKYNTTWATGNTSRGSGSCRKVKWRSCCGKCIWRCNRKSWKWASQFTSTGSIRGAANTGWMHCFGCSFQGRIFNFKVICWWLDVNLHLLPSRT